MKKISFTLISFLSLATLFADGPSKKENDLFLSDDFLFGIENVSDASQTSSMQQNSAPSQASTPRKQTGLSFYGDFLYWNVYPSDYTWCYATFPGDKVDYAPVTFNWDVGFRVGANYKTSFEELVLDLSWLSFHATSNLAVFNQEALDNFSSKTEIVPFMKNYNVKNIGEFYKGNASVKFNLDQIDLVAKVPFKIMDHRFSLIPFGGARAVFFKTKVNQTFLLNQAGYYTQGVYAPSAPQNSYIMNQKDNLWALGLLAGVKGVLSFDHGFDFFMGADAALVGGSETYSLFEDPVIINSNEYQPGTGRTSVKKFRTIVDFETGLTWNRDFNDNRWGLGLKLAYEMHMYFNTPTLRYYYYAAPTVNTTYQGLTAGAFLRF
jgi:hypothetical protein